jgi:phage gpG-like protein
MSLFKINSTNFARFIGRFSDPLAHAKGASRAGLEHVSLVQEGFEKSGVDPETGREGAWPQKQVPSRENILDKSRRNKKRTYEPTPRLQSTGLLAQTITFHVDPLGYEIGPAPLVYAPVHQFGAKIPISAKMRKFLFVIGFRTRKSKTHVVIPPRPYVVLPPTWVPIIGGAYIDAKLESAA